MISRKRNELFRLVFAMLASDVSDYSSDSYRRDYGFPVGPRGSLAGSANRDEETSDRHRGRRRVTTWSMAYLKLEREWADDGSEFYAKSIGKALRRSEAF